MVILITIIGGTITLEYVFAWTRIDEGGRLLFETMWLATVTGLGLRSIWPMKVGIFTVDDKFEIPAIFDRDKLQKRETQLAIKVTPRIHRVLDRGRDKWLLLKPGDTIDRNGCIKIKYDPFGFFDPTIIGIEEES